MTFTREPLKRVLHVTESYGGGVATAIDQYVGNTSNFEHSLLCSVRPKHYQQSAKSQFVKVTHFSKNPFKALSTLISAAKEYDVLHAHSSYAGFFCRLFAPRSMPVVYTPHCYAFERLDLPGIVRSLFRVIEKALASRAAVVAACSQREILLTQDLSSVPAVYVPNVADVNGNPEGTVVSCAEPSFVAIGRLSKQKDPEFFLECGNRIRDRWPQATITWLGGGDEGLQRQLEEGGIEVTGWRGHREALKQLREDNSIYLHTAAWEGFPMSVLEVQAVGLPMIIRSIPAFDGYDLGEKITDPSEVVDAVERVMGNWDEVAGRASRALQENSASTQTARLSEAYSIALKGK